VGFQQRHAGSAGAAASSGGGHGMGPSEGTSPVGDDLGRSQRNSSQPPANPYAKAFYAPGGSRSRTTSSSSAPPLPGGTKGVVTGSPFPPGAGQPATPGSASAAMQQDTPKLGGPTPTQTPS
jgi:hypothetical protein